MIVLQIKKNMNIEEELKEAKKEYNKLGTKVAERM